MTLKLTVAQQRAIETHDRNLVVLAAAGSGKTHVLVERMLALLDANPDWPLESLVAITFTRKAGREMRERLRERLRERRQNAAPHDRERWQRHLASVDNACIDTIHSLCTRVLRLSAAEARLDPEFTVLDEDESGMALDEALEEALQKLAEASDPALALFAEYDRDQIMAALREQVPEPVPAPVPGDLPELWQREWERDAIERINVFRNSAVFREQLKWQGKQEWPNADNLGHLWIKRGEVLEALEAEPDFAGSIELVKGLHGKAGNNGSAKKWGANGLKEARKRFNGLSEASRTVLADIGEGITDLDRRAAEFLPLWRHLILAAKGVYDARKQAGNWIDFNGLEQRAYELLQQPEVRERLRPEFRQVLVDEFHDTSPLQWQIIRALADPREPGRLFIVGDPRQSIYGFRGADVGNFEKALDEVKAGGGLQVTLSQSFRSHQPLLDVLNSIHGAVLPEDQHGPLVSERLCQPGPKPALELLRLNYEGAGLRADEAREVLSRQLGPRLRLLVEEGCPVYDKETQRERLITWGDVAVLFQTHKSMRSCEIVFSELGLPWATFDGRGFYSLQEVADLRNLLRALRNPADELSLASVLRSPLFALSDDALLALRLSGEKECPPPLLWEALQQPEGLPPDELPRARLAASTLEELKLLAGRLTVEEMLRDALRRTGYLATLSGLPDGDRRRANVEKLLDMAAARSLLFTEFETLMGEHVKSHRKAREGEATLESQNAITLMTVHQAKGLEFPLVVLADAGREPGSGNNRAVLVRDANQHLVCKAFDMQAGSQKAGYSWKQEAERKQLRDQAEHRRLLYVASTRAQDYLIICGQMEGKPAKNSWLAWLHEALDLKGRPADVPWRIGGGEVVWRDLAALATECAPQRDGPTGTHDGLDVVTSDGASVELPLLRPVPAKSPGLLHELAVTSLSEHYERSFIRRTGVDPQPGDADEQRILGNVLHDLLRQWPPGSDLNADPVQERLASLLWQQGVRIPRRQAALQRQSTAMLARFEASSLSERMKRAPLLLQELPFMQRHGNCLIQGSIDLLMQDEDGNWTLVDFKSTFLGEDAGHTWAEEHARRFWLQLGLYANALTQRPEVDSGSLTVQVHYLRHGLDAIVPSRAWRQALTELDGIIAIELAESAMAG